ncbi:unnamed protein product, partial [Hapterophycus canaliculatus]
MEERFLLIGDGKRMEVQCYGSLRLMLHCATNVRVALIDIAVVPGLAFNLMYFDRIQEKQGTIIDHTGARMLGGNIHFRKLYSGSYV